MSKVTLEKIVSLCKRRGFVFQSSSIYGGLNGVYDYGPLGVLLKENIKKAWIEDVSSFEEEVVQIDGAILGHHSVWKASGHVDNFSDPMIDCMHCKKRFREDEIDSNKGCPSCGVKNWTEAKEFMLMFQTQVGAVQDQSSIAYLRPETAQTVFVNFKNVMDSTRVKIPFGIAQIGKSFRNEITPKQFLFRVREFEQMELEFFCHPDDSDKYFKIWLDRRKEFFNKLGVNPEKLQFKAHGKNELSHYSKCCTDVEYQFPFGFKELEGIAHRTDFDLKSHQEHSKKDLSLTDEQTKEKYTPHVVECSIGVDRLFATLLFDSYCEEEVEGETRVVLKLHPKIAPIKVAVFPLVKKISENAKKIFLDLKKMGITSVFDESGSIGKRYRRQDEIGTPLCITYDYQSLEDNCVTIRHRDTLKQKRISISDIKDEVLKIIF